MYARACYCLFYGMSEVEKPKQFYDFILPQIHEELVAQEQKNYGEGLFLLFFIDYSLVSLRLVKYGAFCFIIGLTW